MDKHAQKEKRDNLIRDFKKSDKIKIFEIEVLKDEDLDILVCFISIDKKKLIARHEGILNEEDTSTKINLDTIFSLDEHLQTLYQMITDKINDSLFFEIYN